MQQGDGNPFWKSYDWDPSAPQEPWPIESKVIADAFYQYGKSSMLAEDEFGVVLCNSGFMGTLDLQLTVLDYLTFDRLSSILGAALVNFVPANGPDFEASVMIVQHAKKLLSQVRMWSYITQALIHIKNI